MNAPPRHPNSHHQKIHESKLELFRTRLINKLCIALVCGIQFIPRLASVIGSSKPISTSDKITLIALPLTPIMAVIIGVEYLLFKKRGPGILRYSQVIDMILLLIFMADWILLLISSLIKVDYTDPPCFEITALYGFTSFSWKTLLVTFIVQQWQLKIIAPVTALFVATGYAIHYDPDHVGQFLLRCFTQIIDIIVIIYFEDKFRWRMIWTNLQQEKWMQVNNFILNNIPENTMILDVNGETKFVSEYCKSFIKKCRLSSLDTKDFLKRIKDLQQIQYESDPSNSSMSDGFQTIRLTTSHGLLAEADLNKTDLKIETLEDLVINFKNIRAEINLRERHFLVYNAKLEVENPKSLEIKISFIQHFESEYIILILRDTTKRDLLITLEETNKYKDQLLASVSHELRAPLNGNINLVETAINSSKIPENIKHSLLIPALRSSKFLLHIINDFLDLSQIKEKKLRLAFQPESIKETLKSAAQLVELQAQKKGIEFILELDSNLPHKFCTDHMRLSQIVLNLLNNAVKFTKEGTIKLTAVLIDQSQNVKISVEDSGIGMNQENLKKLFANYTHIEFEGRQIMNPNGVGLGLNIAFNLAKLLAPKGQRGITVESIPDQGSIFSLIVENQEKNSEDQDSSHNSCKVADEKAGDKQLTLTSLRHPITLVSRKSESEPLLEICECPEILIVDDNMFNVMAFEAILSSFDVKYDSVYSGGSAIQRLIDRESKKCGKDCKSYSIIFMDQEMPEMNGSETVREIRRLQGDGFLPEIKIIGCTAHKSKEEVERFLESGLDQCIHKPISASMVRDIL